MVATGRGGYTFSNWARAEAPPAKDGLRFRSGLDVGGHRAGTPVAPPPALYPAKAWLDQTSLTARVRSTELKALDKALADYEVKNRLGQASWKDFDGVSHLFAVWKRKTGNASARDRNGAVSELDRMLRRQKSVLHDGLVDSRRGLIYLFSHTNVTGGFVKLAASGLGNVAAAEIKLDDMKSALGVETVVQKAAQSAWSEVSKRAPGPAGATIVEMREAAQKVDQGKFQVAFKKLRDILEKYFTELAKTMRDVVTKPTLMMRQPDMWAGMVEQVGAAVKFVAGIVAANSVPFSGAVDIVTGVAKAGAATFHRLRAYYAALDVHFVAGHPGLIIRQIENAMNLAIGKGLYTALKGAVTFSAEAASAGASKIATLVVAGAEMLAKLIWRIAEYARMKTFFAQCQQLWKDAGRREGNGYAASPFLENGPAFGEWYRRNSVAMPCLSALALTSGIAGDKTRYLQMFTDGSEREVISQQSFDKGVAFLDLLKVNAASYLKDSGFKFSQSG